MKNGMRKVLAVFLVTALLLPLLTSVGSITVKAAAAPTLSTKQRSLVGIGSGFTLTVKNLNNSTVKTKKWYSSNSKIATVNSAGYVTAAAKGTTKINLKITYKNKKTTTLKCSVTVKIPATKIEINNATDTADNNFRHLLQVGEKFDFNVDLTPANSSDIVTFSINRPEIATVDENGVVTGLKPGFAILTAKASRTAAGAAASSVYDNINIEVAAKSARVKTAVVTDSTTLTITFDGPVDAATVFDKDKKLLNVVEITPKADSNGNIASAVGTLKGTLSSDATVLTVNTTKVFNGIYNIHVSSAITSTTGIAVQNYYTDINYKDSGAPYYTGFTVDDSGLKASINFSEAMDFSGLNIVDVRLNTTSTSTQALPATLALLRGKANYKPSTDYKSLIIDLSTISDYDKNKQFTVVMSGVKDMSGNYPTSYNVSVTVGTDTSYKPQASLVNLQRTGYNTLTATFSRNIRMPGTVILSNGETITNGSVDAKDPTKVNYTMSSNAALLSGIQKVSIGMWDAYNVNPSDTSARNLISYSVDFAISSARPSINKFELRMETNNGVDTYLLYLTYNKDVSLVSQAGNLVASRIVTSNNDIVSNRNIGYTASAQGNLVTVILNSAQFSEAGQYTITIPSAFVKDEYYNTNADESVQIAKTATASSVLAPPKLVSQSPVNPSILYVTFADKVDMASAQNVSNYYIPGVSVIKAEVSDNSNAGATITLTLAQGSISYSTIYPITIRNIVGYNNTYTAMKEYNNTIYLMENAGPNFTGISFTYPYTITLTFSENIKGNPSFQATQSGTNTSNMVYSCSVTDNKVIILLNTTPVKGVPIILTTTTNNSITDGSGNASNVPNTLSVTPNY